MADLSFALLSSLALSLSLPLALWTDHLPVTFVAVCCAAPEFQSFTRLPFQFVSHRAVFRPRSVSQRGFQARERRSLGAPARRSAKDRSGSGWHGGKQRTRTRWWWRVARRTPLELQLDQLVKFLGGFLEKAWGAAGVPCLWQPWRGRYVLEALTLAVAFSAVQASVLANWHWQEHHRSTETACWRQRWGELTRLHGLCE